MSIKANNKTPLLEVTDLYTHFHTSQGIARAVDGVSFNLDHGQTLGIVGESGSGKSVLSRTIIDILSNDPSVKVGGQVLFEGQDLRTLSEREMREVRGRQISMVFQDPMSSLNPVMKVGMQIMEVFIKRLGMGWVDSKVRTLELMESVGIPGADLHFNSYPMHLSGGMRQRVAIAIALAGAPKLVIADEPTTALDVTIQVQILHLLRKQQIERNMAIILITHDFGIVSNHTDHILVMYAGQVVENSETKSLINKPMMPYTQALINSIPDLSAPSHSHLNTIKGSPPDVLDIPIGCRFHDRCEYSKDRCLIEMPEVQCAPFSEHSYRCWHPL